MLMNEEKKKKLSIEVCIIGGSIAGNFLAFLLSQKKISCLVIEEHKILGEPFQCAGIISQKICTIAPFPNEFILNRVQVAEINSPNLSSISLQGKESPVIIDRVKFDAYYAIEAQKRGVTYILGEKYLSHSVMDDIYVRINTTNFVIQANILVGADGPTSKVARSYGIYYDLIPAAQGRIQFDYPINKTSMFFNPSWKELFGYIVPEGTNGICRIGLATKNHPNKAFKKFLKILGIRPSQIIQRQGGIIPLGLPSQIAFSHTVLVGDAACMVKATTGGGIVMLTSAVKILANAINMSISHQNYSQKFLRKNYQSLVKRTLGVQLKIHYIIRLILMELNQEDFDLFFKVLNQQGITQLINKYADMDFPLQIVIKLISNFAFLRTLMKIVPKCIKIVPKIVFTLFQ